jgi:HD superfamily phosphohydrolase
MEIRDLIHGSVAIHPAELGVLDSRYFQRLRNIRQLGFAEYSFPSATHNRYIHSLGAMETATQAFDTIFGGPRSRTGNSPSPSLPLLELAPEAHARFRAVVRLAALLHDIGHGPLSHTTEFAMPPVEQLAVPHISDKGRKATHEDYTLKIILDSGLTPLIRKSAELQKLSFGPVHVASLIEPSTDAGDGFFMANLRGEKTDFKPILKQLISSELDADRMDYLRRDSTASGVSYGHFDFDWLVSNLTSHVKDGKCYLALQHRALYSFEDFLISRFHMFLMVYFHYKSVVYDSMLAEYFASPDCDYSLPADIEEYCNANDAHLYSHLAKSRNEWARRITEKRPYRMLIELHSGVPATKVAASEQQQLLTEVEADLKAQDIRFLKTTTTGELSKYFRKPGDPIFVRYDNHYSAPSLIPLEKCTDLFTKYEEKRSITRLYISPEDFARCRDRGRGTPLRVEDAAGGIA